LNRVFDIAQIKYGEKPLPAYTRTTKPSIENVTKKKRAGGQLAKKTSKRKKVAMPSSSKKLGGSDEDMGQETLSQLARDEEVRMISLVFNSSGLTPSMLTLLGDCF
jgi:ornithine carbamoyltransferase